MPLIIGTTVGECTGHIVIDSFHHGSSAGGMRVAPDLSVDEIAALAREMTCKFRFYDLRRGGAKGGLRVPADMPREHLREVMREFGRAIGPVIAGGLYYPGTDLGCGPEELAALYRGAGLRPGSHTDSAFYTAMTVGGAVEACREQLRGGGPTVRLAIEGFGKVGSHLARRLDPAVYSIVAVSTARGGRYHEEGFSPEELCRARDRHGDDLVDHLGSGRRVGHEEVLAADVDILVPAARTWSITRGNADAVGARIIVPAANAPYADGSVEALSRRGVLCLPGFVTNAGGVVGSTFHDRGMDDGSIEAVVRDRYRLLVGSLIRCAVRTRRSPVEVAERYVATLEPPDSGWSGGGLLSRVSRLAARNPLARRRSNSRYIRNVIDNMAVVSRRFDSEPGVTGTQAPRSAEAPAPGQER